MAIKISGTTVINDSQGLENITDINQIVRAPEVVSPTNNETDVDFNNLTIVGSGYNALFGTREYREFQVDLATGDFSNPIVSEQVNSDSLTLTTTESFTTDQIDAFESLTLSTQLAFNTDHKVRIRDVDIDGTVSPFSPVVTFTTGVDPFQALGTAFGGGFSMGTICAAGTCYGLIVAPNATGCACCQWKTTSSTTSGTCSDIDGYANTYPALENSTHPAGNWTATRTIDGFSDWYLPAFDELEVFYNNGGGNGSGDPLPSGEDFATTRYFSSTEAAFDLACGLNFSNATPYARRKICTEIVRAVRRVPI